MQKAENFISQVPKLVTWSGSKNKKMKYKSQKLKIIKHNEKTGRQMGEQPKKKKREEMKRRPKREGRNIEKNQLENS